MQVSPQRQRGSQKLGAAEVTFRFWSCCYQSLWALWQLNTTLKVKFKFSASKLQQHKET